MADPTVTSLAAGESATASTQVNFTAQAAGALLVLTVATGDYKTGDPSGWTLLQSGQDYLGAYVWYKLATGSETSVTYAIGSAVQSAYTLVAATNIAQTLPVDVSDVLHTHGAGIPATPSVTTSTGRRLVLACVPVMNSSAAYGTPVAWSNSYVTAAWATSTITGDKMGVMVGSLVLDGGGATSTAVTLTEYANCNYGVTAVFKVAAATGDATVTAVAATATAAAPAPTVDDGYPDSTIAWRTATGLTAAADVTTPFATLTYTLPTGHTTGDLLVAIYAGKPFNTQPSTPTDYTSIVDVASGTTAMGNGTGSVRLRVFQKTHDGTEANPTSTFTAQYSPGMVAMLAASKTPPGAWVVDATTATAETTSVALTGAAQLAYTRNDEVVVVIAHRDNDATETNPVITVPGCTVGAVTQQLASTTTATGNDGELYVYRAQITSGTASGAPQFAATVAASEGWVAAAFLRIAEPAGAVDGSVTAVAAAVTVAAVAPVVTGMVVVNAAVTAVAAAVAAATDAPIASGETVITGGGPAEAGVAAVPPTVTAEGTNAAVTATPAAATVDAPAPTVAAVQAASVTATPAAATAAAVAPATAGDALVTVVQSYPWSPEWDPTEFGFLGDVTAEASAPATAAGAAVTAGTPPDATVAAVAPAVSAVQAPTVTATPALVTVDAAAPAVTGVRDATVTATPAVVTVDAPPPAIAAVQVATVTATPAAATVDAPAAAVTGDATVTATPAAVDVTAPAPTVSGATAATVTTPAATVGVAALAPTATGGGDATATAATVDVAALAPAVAGAATVPATPAAAVTVDALPPTVDTIRVATAAAPAALVDVAAVVPTVSGAAGGEVAITPATVTVDAVAPTVTGVRHAAVTAVPAEATVDAVAPAVSATTEATVTAPAAAVTAAAVAPTVDGAQNVTVTATPAAATVDAPSPTVATTSAGTVTAPAAVVTATAVGPTVFGGTAVTVTATPAAVDVAAAAPTVTTTSDATITAPAAAITATALPPTTGLADVWVWSGVDYKRVTSIRVKHPTDGWRQVDNLRIKTSTGWRSIIGT